MVRGARGIFTAFVRCQRAQLAGRVLVAAQRRESGHLVAFFIITNCQSLTLAKFGILMNLVNHAKFNLQIVSAIEIRQWLLERNDQLEKWLVQSSTSVF